jgi:hypothetical protein
LELGTSIRETEMTRRVGLTGEALLRVWERGASLHPVDRALTILAAVHPEVAPERLAALSVGRRDTALLRVRQATLGPAVRGFVACPTCGEKLELALDGGDLEAAIYPIPDEAAGSFEEAFAMDRYSLRFRLIDSFDLAAAAACPDPSAGRAELLRRCVVGAERDGVPVTPADIPEPIIRELAGRMAEVDPQAECRIDLTCPVCDLRWQAPFDVVDFFWAEIAAAARRLLREVHGLARAYGWREADILAMSSRRRRAYLELTDG